jgi:hypothetical protein
MMGFRRSPDRAAAARDWKQFVESNAHVIVACGLPPAATARIDSWDELLTHGFLADDPGRFMVDQLTPDQYRSLVELISNYFSAGYEFYTPMALKPDDQALLRARFA